MPDDNIKPQHDFDEQKRIRWEITQKGREALESELRAEYERGHDDGFEAGREAGYDMASQDASDGYLV